MMFEYRYNRMWSSMNIEGEETPRNCSVVCNMSYDMMIALNAIEKSRGRRNLGEEMAEMASRDLSLIMTNV